MKSYRIVVIPGDGIGPEIVEAALAVLDKIQQLAGDFLLSYDFRQAGAAYYREHGENISAETLEAIRASDATLKGPVGLPGVRQPDGTEAGLLGGTLRIGLDLYANVRPVRGEGADIIIIRENTEGLYAGTGGVFKKGTPDEVAQEVEAQEVLKQAEEVAQASVG